MELKIAMSQPNRNDLVCLISKYSSRTEYLGSKLKHCKQIIPLLEIIANCRAAIWLPENAKTEEGANFAATSGILLLNYGVHCVENASELDEFIDIFYEPQPQISATNSRLLSFLAELVLVEINNLSYDHTYESQLLYRKERNLAVSNLVAWFQSYCQPRNWLVLIYDQMQKDLYRQGSVKLP